MGDNTEKDVTRRKTQSGVSMVEVIIVMGIVGVMASLAFPSFSQMFARSRLRATAEQIRADLNVARSEAQKRNQTILMNFTINADNSWCYGLTTSASCNCTVTDAANTSYCFLDRDAGGVAIPSSVSSTNYRGIAFVGTPFTDHKITFNAVRPMLESSSVTLVSSDASARMRIIASGLGRIRFCSPDGSLSGYPSC